MSEINFSPPGTASLSSSAPVTAPHMSLTALQPLETMLAPSQRAQGEVIAQRDLSSGQHLTLRLTLPDGRTAQLQVRAGDSPALPAGSQLQLTAQAGNRLLASLVTTAAPPLQRLDLSQLPAGSLLQARVLSNTPNSVTNLQQIIVQVLSPPLAGRQLVLESAQPLLVGSLLSAQVRDGQTLQFLPLGARLEQLDVLQQLASQHSRQGSLHAVFNALARLEPHNLSPALRQSVEQLHNSLPTLSQLGDSQRLAQAMKNSGLGLEQRLLSGQAGALPQDLKANLLRLVAQLAPALNSLALATTPATAALASSLPSIARSLLGALGQQSGRAPGLSFPLPSRLAAELESEGDVQSLLKLAAAAISRVQTHQLSSLAQTQAGPENSMTTTWQMELPLRDQPTPLQIKIQQEQPDARQGESERDSLWKIDLAFDLSPLGALQVQAQLSQGRLSGQLWATHAQTATLIAQELEHLRERLQAAGLTVGELSCREGVPPQPSVTRIEHRWIDDNA
jgi:hypothetical protein